jgi:5'-deoxynucleotidase YfbR-like HD superfamily hydrolase
MREIRRLSVVKRWAIVPMLRSQSVAEHSYFVAMYALAIAEALDLSEAERLAVVVLALRHDVAEAMSGDLPGPLKRALGSQMSSIEGAIEKHMFGSVGVLPEEKIRKVVKLADKVDAAVWMLEEVAMGNGRVVVLAERARADALESAEAMGVAGMVSMWLDEARAPVLWYADNV